jgi:predicted RNase H-like nuclease (RuvC/YqgF family)
MTRSAKQWQRNTTGLRSHAQRKAAVTAQRAEAALARLIQEQRPITFTAVAEMAGISTAWLYEHEPIKERIMHLRAERSRDAVQVKIPPREQASSASKETMIAALRQRIQKLEQENRDLRRQVEVAYGLLQKPAEEKRS